MKYNFRIKLNVDFELNVNSLFCGNGATFLIINPRDKDSKKLTLPIDGFFLKPRLTLFAPESYLRTSKKLNMETYISRSCDGGINSHTYYLRIRIDLFK